MKTLTGTLEAAQRSSSAVPYVRARFADYWGYARRGRPQRVYDGSEQVLQHAAALSPGDGSLIRARLQTTGADTLFVSRVAAPDAGSTFSSWSALTTDISDVAGVAIAVNDDDVWIFCVEADDVSIRVFKSADNGATFDGGSAVATAGAAVGALAAAFSDGNGGSDGDVLAAWVEDGSDVYRSRWGGVSWGARTASTQSFHAVSGLALVYLLDWQVVITGQAPATEEHRVWACRYGDGINQTANTWGTLRVLAEAAAASGVSFGAPAAGYNDVWRVFFVESYSGDEGYDRVQWSTMDLSHDFNEEQWREPVGFDYEDAFGLALALDATTLWLTAPDGVWLTETPAFAELDVTADVVEASVRAGGDGAIAELELNNAGGGYTAYGSGGLGALQRGSRLQLTPGYRSAAGDEVPLPYAYWVESVELVTGPRPLLRVRARDGWWLLVAWRARRQFVWAAGDKTVSQLLLFITARAGVEYSSVGASAALTTLQPAFTIHAGESGLTAVRRLLAMVEDVALWDGAELTVLGHADDDASGYDLGAGHDVVEARYRDLGPAVNRVRVIGLGVSGEAFGFEDGERAERIATVVDVNLDAGSEAADRAAAVLRKAYLESFGDELKLFGVHCGVELWDVVDVTDAQVGLVEAPRRVRGYGWAFDTRRGRYEMDLTLGPV